MGSGFWGVAAAMVLMTSSVSAQSEVFIDQIGDNLLPIANARTVSLQDVAHSASEAGQLLQKARGQFPLTSSSSLLIQDGDRHMAALDQAGPGNLGVVLQTGMMNSVNLMQTGSGHGAIIVQSGHQNSAAISQRNANQSAIVAQHGTGNVAIISQQ